MAMGDRDGDPAKRIPGCRGSSACPNLKETSGPTDMDKERYECAVCGERFTLYYEDMA